MKKFFIGFVVGIIIVTACLATDIVVNRSTHTVVVNGNEIAFDAYNINGYNYFKLKDLGKALDFYVWWDESEQKVLIDSSKSYEEQGKTEVSDNITKVPQSVESFCPAEGTIVEAEVFRNGEFTGEKTTFTVTKAKPAEAALPEATCDWSQFPEIELPKAVAKDLGNGRVVILNLHETRRMQLDLYNCIGSNPETWQNGTIAKYKNGMNKVEVSLDILGEPQMMWPYRASDVKEVFDSSPCRTWRVVAYDTYHNGRYLHTAYYLE